MKRTRLIWILFGAGLCVVLAAAGWVSAMAVDLERSETETRARADREEEVRLALWRMETALAPVLVAESSRPYFTYTAFYPAERAYTRMFAELRAGDVLVPSPLLTFRSPYVRIHFQVDPKGQLSSPQVPAGNQRDVAEAKGAYVTFDRVETFRSRLTELTEVLDVNALQAAVANPDGVEVATRTNDALPQGDGKNTKAEPQSGVSEDQDRQTFRGTREWTARRVQVAGVNAYGRRKGVSEGSMRAVWQGKELFFVRRVVVQGQDYLQGLWFDWKALRSWLLEQVGDIMKGAELVPPQGGSHPTRLLASLPLVLQPGAVAAAAPALRSPVQFSLIVAWACLLLGIAAVAVLLRAAVGLSDRRAAFVSAVTHELRTPLTTFRLYSEMLAGGMLKDEGKQKEYLHTLQSESERLGHLVENVLAYARIERGGDTGKVQPTETLPLVEDLGHRLGEHARRAGLAWSTTIGEGLPPRVDTDPSAVERILFNLVDNAAKYARREGGGAVELRVETAPGGASLAIRDDGPGIQPADRARIFRPFRKSAEQAARTAPGVGLGLALSRRLARSMGGDLVLDETVADGACFVLQLRKSPS